MQQLTALWIPAGLAHAATCYIPEPLIPVWVWPLMALAGIACQLAAAFTRCIWLAIAGLLPMLAGAFMDRDITLAIGGAAACFGLVYGMRKW